MCDILARQHSDYCPLGAIFFKLLSILNKNWLALLYLPCYILLNINMHFKSDNEGLPSQLPLLLSYQTFWCNTWKLTLFLPVWFGGRIGWICCQSGWGWCTAPLSPSSSPSWTPSWLPSYGSMASTLTDQQTDRHNIHNCMYCPCPSQIVTRGGCTR